MEINKLKTKKDFEEVFICLNEQIFRYVYVRCGYNRELAEDMAQDIFIKAWEKRKLFNPGKSSLQNWLYIIARNYIIDFYRTKKSVASINIDQWDTIVNDVPETTDSELMLETVLSGLEKLSQEDKELITLRYIQDLRIEDISKIINKGYIATKVAIHRATKRLKKVLNA